MANKNLCLVLGDQLNLNMSSLARVDKKTDMVLMAEVNSEATYVKHHKSKIAFIFSAMRHFAQQLHKQGYQVSYIKYDDSANRGSLFKEVEQIVHQHAINTVIVAKPGELRLYDEMIQWDSHLKCDVDITHDNRFLATEADFATWADGKKQLRMEFFYREMRRNHDYLLDNGKPIGGKWNYDSDNRQKHPKDKPVPQPTKFATDEITQEVLQLVQREFDDHFGSLEHFHYAVTREQALIVLDEFISQRLPEFGQYQDAMVQNEAWMYHSHVSFYINAGLLHPNEVMRAAEQAYFQGAAPINSVEGFIRQILGWREYVRGFYWYFMPELKTDNFLQASLALPEFFWSGETDMNCISQSVKQTKDYAYAHHIQRLMVLGNFALLAGIDPEQVNEWYLIVYADAYEWVELPNVSGMILYSDGGKLASKPYAASGAYINKMSNYCAHCRYSVKEKHGEQACPFNYLYWYFVNKHKPTFEKNPRMAMIYRTMAKMDEKKLGFMLDDASSFLTRMNNNEKV